MKGNERMENQILFSHNISIGLLEVSTSKFSRLDNVGKDHVIFERIKAPFNWYFHDTIMVIPDPVSVARKDWNKKIFLCSQEIECQGEFIIFCHMNKKVDKIIQADSLTLPEYQHIKDGLNFS
ncbi:hypothetical protein [Pontibacillus litoralis]|uniref:Uncharacterized protein n=1 Tax=Pontibacillus litoralis JSM 072002 TaxID=1385512 RepID=A0A0A5FTP6_9BACI|nr:hypothetical protein [Pontibacillus litoralis]KGX84136.1 hypothetical protein N784_14595 [Pontibacillus litoralis JSM 072002]